MGSPVLAAMPRRVVHPAGLVFGGEWLGGALQALLEPCPADDCRRVAEAKAGA
jgi:hypothetical protein